MHRAPRPLIGWVYVALGAALVAFILVVLYSMGRAFLLTAAQGHPVPDVTGGLGNLATLISAIVGAIGMGAQWMANRHRERRDEIAFSGGQVSSVPFASSDGPRPGDSA